MFRHHFLLTYRNFKRFKGSFFINLLGLSTGLACALLIYLWVNDEWRMDKFHEHDSRLYQIMERQQASDALEVTDSTPGLLADALEAEMPEVEYAVSVSWIEEYRLIVGEKQLRAAGQWVGGDFFKVFSYGLTQGDPARVLSDKKGIVISESLAKRLFNTTEEVLGKVITLPENKEYQVSGVFRDVPSTSSSQFDFVLSFEAFKEINPWLLEWTNNATFTYVVLQQNTDISRFNQKIAPFVQQKEGEQHITLFAKPYSENYLYGKWENGVAAGGRIEYVRMFSLIAFFILGIACINYMNLSTAKAARRLKEVGVKKALGASRKVLLMQYLGESLLMAFISLLLALLLVVLFLPQFNVITGKQLSLQPEPGLVLAVMAFTIATGLLSGSYPALYLSGFNPVAILKGGGLSGKRNSTASEVWARKALVVFQFSLSVLLIVAVLVVYQQIEYTQTKHLGYSKDNLLHFEAEGKLGENLETFLSEANKLPGIRGASSIGHSLVEGGYSSSSSTVEWEGKAHDEIIEMESVRVNYNMIELLEIQMQAGRTFAKSFSDDKETTIIFNEAAIEAMGLRDPVGKVVRLWGKEREIVGVAKNFHFDSFHEKVKPQFFILASQQTRLVMAKIKAGQEQTAIAGLQELYQQFNPGFTFDYRFLDEDYQAQYEAEQRVATLSRYFAGLAILISCLGLYGLAAFAAEQRTKEIGIRKVLGASVTNIMTLLSKDFIKLVAVAIVLGSLLSWIAMQKWLEGFVYKIELGWWVFGVAGAAALLIAVCTVSYQAIKAAMANPVKNLRSE